MKPFEVSDLNLGPSGPSILGGGDGGGIINDPTHTIAIVIIM